MAFLSNFILLPLKLSLWIKKLYKHEFVVEKGKGHRNNGGNYIYLFFQYHQFFLGHRALIFVLNPVNVDCHQKFPHRKEQNGCKEKGCSAIPECYHVIQKRDSGLQAKARCHGVPVKLRVNSYGLSISSLAVLTSPISSTRATMSFSGMVDIFI